MSIFNELFIYENGKLLNKKTRHEYHNKDRDGYIRVRVLGREFRAHRIIWEMHNTQIPEGMLVDHIDGNTSNNNINNLRLATRQQNNASRINGTSIYGKGISITPNNTYRARIYHKGKHYCLGTFKTVEQARDAYNKKHFELNGDFYKASINPEQPQIELF